jgi:hypothetical protein
MTENGNGGTPTLKPGLNGARVENDFWRTYRRPVVTLALTMPPLSLVVGFLYSETSLVHGGGGIAAVVLPSLLFAVLLVVFAAGRLHSHPGLTVVALVVASAGPFLVGHALNYQATKDWTYDYARRGMNPPLPESWQGYDREETFRSYVGLVTGVDGAGFRDYFRLQASVGCPGWQGARHYRHEVNRSGPAVYAQWSYHVLYFFLAGLLAYYVTKPRKNQIEPV